MTSPDHADSGASPPGAINARSIAIWVELFYDLIYVAAMLIFSAAVEHVRPQSGVVWIIGSFAAVWWIWFVTTACANRFPASNLIHRLLLLFQMMVIVLMSMEARVSVIRDSNWLAFDYGLLLLTVAIMYARAWRTSGDAGALRLAVINGAAALPFLVASGLPESPRIVLCVIGLVVATVPYLLTWRRLEPLSAQMEEHFVERMAAFTLIVFGEAFIEVAIRVSGPKLVELDLVSMAYEFLLTFVLFTIYFRDAPAAGVQRRRFEWWSFWHLFMLIGIASTAIAATQIIHVDPGHHLPNSEILKLSGSLVLFFVGIAGVGYCGRRSPRGPLLRLRLATAVAVTLIGVACWQCSWIHRSAALGAFLVVAVGSAMWSSRLRAATEVLPAEVEAIAA